MSDAIRAVLFDKDGTLFDFHATWSAWAAGLLDDLAGGNGAAARGLADRIGYDYGAGRFHADSEVIAGTPDDIAEALLGGLDGWTQRALVDHLNAAAAVAPQAEAVPLRPFLAQLRAAGLALGVATNDAEVAARAHLAAAGIVEALDFIVGYDSGHGGKPGPGMCLAFAKAMDLPPEAVVMVGDSTHDLHAGRAAGMRTVAVLTGLAQAEELAPHADVVLPDIGHLPEWLGL